MGADIVDVNMGCPVPKIAKHNAGCSLMREPAHAAAIIAAMTKAVKIPVTVKMRKGWDDGEVNAPRAGAARRGRRRGGDRDSRPHREAELQRLGRLGFRHRSREDGVDSRCSDPATASSPRTSSRRLTSGVSGVFVGRGVLRNPWILAQARDLMAGRPARTITHEERGQFLLDYMQLLLAESATKTRASGTWPQASRPAGQQASSVGRERWVINKMRALCSWYTKGFEGGAQFRIGVNSAKSIASSQDLIESFFLLAVGLPACWPDDAS